VRIDQFLLLALVIGVGLTGVGCKSSRSDSSSQLRANTEQARAENNRAYQLIQQGKYEDAEKALKRAIAADVMYGPARNNLGLVYYHQGRLYEAAWEFQNAARLMPYQPEPRNNLGLVFERAGKMTDAADAYDRARQLEPDNPEFLGNLARAKVRRGDKDEETKRLLEELVMKDSRPQWNDWARMNLLRMERPVSRDVIGATTQAAPRP
jgi:Tfp pilus assembly protein PilF